MRIIIKIGLVICLLALFYGANGQSLSESATQPNIVLILVDDAALQDFGCYGGEAATPNIDMLASDGVMFTNHHASPMCAPSRAMLLTGYDSHLTGVPNLPIFTPPEISQIEGYEGILNDKVLTVATRLKNNGYRTYTTGKWHLGHTEQTLPTKRGFDRSYILDASGADNYEMRPYLPTQSKNPPWYKDGERLGSLPDDFYSSKNLVDEMIQFHREEADHSSPFFSYLAFQAIHIPVQVPAEYTEKYIDTYSRGWDPIKIKRYKKAKELGIISAEASMGTEPSNLREWNNLTEDEKKYTAKAMAVNAGMLEAMDYHIGRYMSYLKEKGEYDNTIFVITSDNGPEASSAGSVPVMKLWLRSVGYHMDVDRLGEKASYGYIGAEFAQAAAGPSSYFKFYAGEGGLRVPLIFSGVDIPADVQTNAFTFITDITPTLLRLAGIKEPKVPSAGPMTGRDLSPLLFEKAETVYSPDEAVGMEAAGHGAIYRGDYKLTRNGKTYGDNEWRLHHIKSDPGEMIDLKESEPTLFAEMIKEYHDYTEKYQVVEMGINYEPLSEIQNKLMAQLTNAARPWIMGILGVILLWVLVRVYKSFNS